MHFSLSRVRERVGVRVLRRFGGDDKDVVSPRAPSAASCPGCPQACRRELRGTEASRKSIWSATMRRPRRIMSSCRLGT